MRSFFVLLTSGRRLNRRYIMVGTFGININLLLKLFLEAYKHRKSTVDEVKSLVLLLNSIWEGIRRPRRKD